MKGNKFKEYLSQSLAGFGSLALAILFYFALYQLRTIVGVFGSIVTILMPLIYGGVIAFLLSPLCNWLYRMLSKYLGPKIKNSHRRYVAVNGLSVAGTMILALITIYLLLVAVIPQILESMISLINRAPVYTQQVTNWVQNLFNEKPELQQQATEISSLLGGNLTDWLQNHLMPQMQTMVDGLSESVVGLVMFLKNLLIGLVISIYLLFNRKVYIAQSRKVLYALFPPRTANYILSLCRETSDIFSGFIVGKLLDSLIIGLICFAFMWIFGFPMAVLCSAIVGVTNVIPYFGPLIGMIPTTLLMLTVSPVKALYFLIFVIVLQQVDGNIIGPKILGNTTGVSSFWVLISLVFFGSIWGVVGLVVGVPLFAVIYDLAVKGVGWLLKRRNLSGDTADYAAMDHVDPETHEIIQTQKK